MARGKVPADQAMVQQRLERHQRLPRTGPSQFGDLGTQQQRLHGDPREGAQFPGGQDKAEQGHLARPRGLADRLVLVDGASKAYSMTGWRVGFAAGPRPIVAAMRALQSHATSGTASISQKAATEAFGGDQSEVERMRQEFQKRRDVVVEALNAVPGFRCTMPDGAFYAYPSVHGALGCTYQGHRVETSLDLASYLLDTAHVSVVPGEAFGTPGYLRLSYATSMERIEQGLDRIARAMAVTSPSPVAAA